MASVGIVGGIGPESTIDYYRRILAGWSHDHPGTSPSIVIDSLDVQVGLRLSEHDRPGLVEYVLASLRRLAGAGVDFAAMAANTPHIVFGELASKSPVPLVSIVEATTEEARRLGLRRVAILGTKFTMESSMYPDVCGRYGIQVVAPDKPEREMVHDRYVNQMLKGDFREETRSEIIALIDRLRSEKHIGGVILGGTELTLLLTGTTVAGLPALDTTALHVAAILKRLEQ